MREILFRAKRLDNGEWVEGFYFIDERDIEDGVIWRDVPQIQQRYGDHYDYFDVDPLTIGQFTGLTDKSGKKIFEGDVVVQPVRETRTHSPCEIEFHDGKFMAHYKSEKHFYDRYYDINSFTKIIGNIHNKQNGGD